MFLAIKEIMHEKLRYGLILAMFILISYLIIILMGLMLGLANENTAAIKSWDTETVFLNKNSNDNLSQSLINREQIKNFNDNDTALIGVTPVVMKTTDHERNKQNVQFVGLDETQYIYQKKLNLVSGHRPQNNKEVVVDESLQDQGYRLGQKIMLNSSKNYQIVGFSRGAKLNISPVVYGSLSDWRDLKGINNSVVASGVISNQELLTGAFPQLQRYSVQKFIEKLPGYTAQNTTFIFMIGFLMVISLIIIAVFLYILTMQKMSHFAVLRAQGVPAKHLVKATMAQALILVVVGYVGGVILTELTSLILPTAVPILMNWPLIGLLAVVMVILGMVGALLPVRLILKIDPAKALG
ncbi:ABC transporter permease [Limosilactobacillus agrestimuris]|uniref:ABC transporter permease n=1 Tax=Limosilactobacillus agrestimuris TaxID=2941331 RepID=UPI00203A9D50|nr:ABC transporter permease [Limosilactobacillus agrestimuris]